MYYAKLILVLGVLPVSIPLLEESTIYQMNLVNSNNETNTMAMIFLVDFFI